VAIINPSVLQTVPRNQQSLPKKATKSNSFGLVTLICLLKKISPRDVSRLGLGTTAQPPKINSVRGIGLVRHGEVKFMADKDLHDLEIEFTEWKTQQKHIMSKVDELHSDMTDVKKAVFQAKWMLAGALVLAGVLSSDNLVEIIAHIGSK
jgi:hypothetical protein